MSKASSTNGLVPPRDDSSMPGVDRWGRRRGAPFNAILAPSLLVRQSGAPSVLHAVLLSRLPDPDGFGGVFLDDAISPSVRLQDVDAQHLAIVHPLHLETQYDDPVVGVGLVDPSGRPAFAGRLLGRDLGAALCRSFWFASYALRLRRSRSWSMSPAASTSPAA